MLGFLLASTAAVTPAAVVEANLPSAATFLDGNIQSVVENVIEVKDVEFKAFSDSILM